MRGVKPSGPTAPPPIPVRQRTAFDYLFNKLGQILPPVRLTWIALLTIAVYGSYYFLGLGWMSILTLPIIGIATDLPFQWARYKRFRVPDAAIATSLFLTLLLPPTVNLLAASAITVGAVTLRHVLRYRGRPLFNPAATGMILAAVVFAAAPAWWVSVGPQGETLLLGVALLSMVRSWRSWRLPVVFLTAFAIFTLPEHLLTGATSNPQILLLTIFDPGLLFFALFMLVEPRTAPTDLSAQPLFAAVVAFGAAFFPLVLPTIGIFVALCVGNLFTAGLRAPAHPEAEKAPPSTRKWKRKPMATEPLKIKWPVPQRIAAGFVAALLIGVIAGATVGPPNTMAQPLVSLPSTHSGEPVGGGGNGVKTTGCKTDNPSIPASTLGALHKALGPSVILSYSPNQGSTVFYDPINHVTVTETDLFEDYGYAEFNGDDFAVSGCVP